MSGRERLRDRESRAGSAGLALPIHLVHLYEQGRYVRTWPEPFTAQGAAAFVACYNRLGRQRGCQARQVVYPIELPAG